MSELTKLAMSYRSNGSADGQPLAKLHPTLRTIDGIYEIYTIMASGVMR